MTTHRDTLLAAAQTAADAKFPEQTQGQRQSIANAIADDVSFSTWCAEGWSWPSEQELGWSADRAVKADVAMIREVPDAMQVYEALLAAHEKLTGELTLPQDKINLKRRVDSLSADQRLAATEKLVTPPKRAPVVETKPAANDDDLVDDQLALALGYRDRNEMRAKELALKTLARRKYFRANRAVLMPTTPVAKSVINPNDPAFASLSPTERIRRFRAASK